MATLRNLRAYVPGTNETPEGTNPAGYDTGTNNGILRKINLNVDIATQNELNEAFTTLSNAITATGTEWKEADIQLSNNLKAWAKGDELSGALHNEITAEANRASTAEQEISAALTAWNVTVDKTEETSSYVYTIKQGGVERGTIDIAKDIFVTSADFEGTILILHLANGQVISTDLSGLVDQYTGGTTDFATVDITDNVVKAYVSADLISAAAVTTVVGQGTDFSTADTINGVRAYVNEKVADKNVDAEGDVYVSASAANNKVTVAATADLCAAVALANSSVQGINSSDDTIIYVEGRDGQYAVGPTERLTAAVAAAETALQTISAGTDGSYVTTTVTAKDANRNQTVGVAVTVAALTAGTNGLAEATDVKQYVDGKITDLSVSAAGDAYVTASSTGKAITVAAADRTKAAIDKVEAASATWDAALQTVSGSTGSYVTITATDKANNNQVIGATVTTHALSNAVAETADGLAVASDAKKYVDDAVAGVDKAFVKGVNTQTTAYVEITGDTSLTGNKIVTVNLAQSACEAIDAVASKADLTALNAETTARENADTTLETRIDGLSATYVNKTTYDAAAATLDAAITAKALSAYADIDEILTELEALKAAVKAFADSTKTA